MPDPTHILVIDDDPQLLDTVVTLLENVGYRVSAAPTLEEAVGRARAEPPDLIVLDLSLQAVEQAEGEDMIRPLYERLERPRTPLLILSGIKGTVDVPARLRPEDAYAPLQAVLDKPFRPRELLEQIEELLELARTVEQEGGDAAQRARGTILVVDDDPDFQQIVGRILQSRGYRVTPAASGAAALEMMERAKPDLVILDVMMSSVLDGVGVSEAMRREPTLRDVPVLMVSSIADTEYAGTFPTDQPLHIDAWISKPVRPDDLLAKIEGLLGDG
ncbi:MAG TPA: response regulator [Anaerolineae bacterium]|nr:response regulator [Anaerolineae bacterium]